MNEEIVVNESLILTEANISKALTMCDYWGELKLSKEDYFTLIEMIKERAKDRTKKQKMDFLFANYPLSTVTTMVFFLVFEYNHDFWSEWASRIDLELSQNMPSIIGRNVLEVFEKYGMTRYSNDGYKYVTPLLCQAGIPDSELDNIFYSIFTAGHFDPNELIKEYKGWRSHQITKTIERFICFHEEKAIDKLITINDVMLNGENAAIGDSYEGRVREQYLSWKETYLNSNGKLRKRQGKDFQENPYLFFDEERGLCISLPEFIIKDEYCQSVRWNISYGIENSYDLVCDIIHDGNQYHSNKKIVPVEPAESYAVKIFDDDLIENNMLNDEWFVSGYRSPGYLLFNHTGKKITDNSFDMNGAFLFIDQTRCAIKSNKNTYLDRIIFPNSGNTVSFSITPQNIMSKIVLDGNEMVTLTVRKTINAALSNGRYLFDEKKSGVNVPLYVELPELIIEEVNHADNITIMLRNRDSGIRTIHMLNEYVFSSANNLYIIPIESLTESKLQFGRYSLRIYESGAFRKEIEFGYVPVIEYDDFYEHQWPDKDGILPSAGFRYRLPENVQIAFDDVVSEIIEEKKHDLWKRVNLRGKAPFITGSISYLNKDLNFNFEFQKRVRNISWNIWDAEDDVNENIAKQTLDLSEFIEHDIWITIYLNELLQENNKFSLCLMSKNEELKQEISISFKDRGKWRINLSSFRSTLEAMRLPAKIAVRREYEEGNYDTFTVLNIIEPVLLEQLSVGSFSDTKKPFLKWNRSNINFESNNIVIRSLSDYEFEDIEIKNVRNRVTQKGIAVQLLPLEKELPKGIYRIEYAEDDIFGFDDNLKLRLPSVGDIFLVKRDEVLNALNQLRNEDIACAVLANFNHIEILRRINIFLSKYHDRFKGLFEKNSLLIFLSLYLYARKQINGECESTILEILETLNDGFFRNEDRSKMLTLVLEADISDDEKKYAIDFYDLEFALLLDDFCNRERFNETRELNPLLSLRIVLKSEKSEWMADALLACVGIDSIEKIVPADNNGRGLIQLEKYFRGKKISLDLQLPEEVVGVSDQFYELFDWGSRYKKPTIDLKRKPENEPIFFGDGYVNLLIRWYLHAYESRKEIINEIKMEIPRFNSNVKAKISTNTEAIIKYKRRTYLRQVEAGGGFYPILQHSMNLALCFCLMDFGLVNFSTEEINAIFQHLRMMKKAFPELLIRDIVMASLYLYFSEV